MIASVMGIVAMRVSRLLGYGLVGLLVALLNCVPALAEWLRERGAMACPGCGLGVRILPQRPGQEARCPECKAPLPTLPAEPERIEVMDVFVERLRVTGHRLGSQVLSETAAVASAWRQ